MKPSKLSVILASLAFAGCTAPATEMAAPEAPVITAAGIPFLVESDPSSSPVGPPQATSGGGATQDYEGTWFVGLMSGGSGVCMANGPMFNGTGFTAPGDGVWFDWFPIEPGTIGAPFQARLERQIQTPDQATEPVGLTFLDARGDPIFAGSTPENSPVTGKVPTGAATGVFWSCLSVPMRGTYHAGPRNDEPAQREEAAWSLGLRGPACYSSVYIPCCHGAFADTIEDVGDGIRFDRFSIDQDTWGMPYRAHIRVSLPTSEGGGLTFLTPDGPVHDFTGFDSPLGDSGRLEGIVPQNATAGVFWTCLSGPMTAVYEAGPWYESSPVSFTKTASPGIAACDAGFWAGIWSDDSFAWTIPDTRTDGSAARVSRIELRFASLAMSGAKIWIEDATGAILAHGRAPLVTRNIDQPGTYTIHVDPCGAAAGSYYLFGSADLVKAT